MSTSRALIFTIFIILYSSSLLAQNKWVLEEQTNINGLVSGTIQKGHIFKTASGSIYEVTGITIQLVLELSPEVMVLRQGNDFKLIIEGFDDPLICSQLLAPKHKQVADSEDVIESHIEGNFSGWDGETVFRLTNGQIWQQVSYAYVYHYAYRPKVLIYKSGNNYTMKVDGVRQTIQVYQLK